MNKKIELWCAHSGLLAAVLMCLGVFGVAGWLPVHDPAWSAEQVARVFHDGQTRIQAGMMILAISGVFFWSFSAAISMQMKRIEGNDSHPLSYIQMGSASGTVMAIVIPAYLWLAMSYRPGGPAPETLQVLNDFNWMVFIGLFPPAALQNVSIAVCILSDKSRSPVYPRWVGISNLVEAAGFVIPGVFLPFSKSGAFAWNGIIGFWMVAALFFSWIVTMWWATVRAIGIQAMAPR